MFDDEGKSAIRCSSGANVWAACQVAQRPENTGKVIVTVACSTGERYLSTALAAEAKAEVGGYAMATKPCVVGRTYVVHTYDGRYARFQVRSLEPGGRSAGK